MMMLSITSAGPNSTAMLRNESALATNTRIGHDRLCWA